MLGSQRVYTLFDRAQHVDADVVRFGCCLCIGGHIGHNDPDAGHHCIHGVGHCAGDGGKGGLSGEGSRKAKNPQRRTDPERHFLN